MSAARLGTGGRAKVVLLGMMTKMPVAGVVWQNLHYLLGLERLGCEAFYVETHARAPTMLMSSECDDGATLAAEFIAAVMRRFDLADRWAYRALHDGGRCFGMSEAALERLYGSAAAIVNLHGATRPTPELAATGRLVYLETDPVQLQLELHQRLQATIDFLEPHSAFFTFAENWGGVGCRLPLNGRFRFLPTRQPVLLDLWPDRSREPAAAFTTVGNWRQDWRDVSFDGERYTWSKHHEFPAYLDLPVRTGCRFEPALSSCRPQEREMLRSRGWAVRDGLEVSRDIDRYRDFIGSSRGEFTVAKEQNVRLRTGWFSDRSATYLASGRPVVTQDTGFAGALPTGRGLFAFDSPDSAVEALARIEADYPLHARAARELAREHFDHEVVLGGLLEHLAIARARGRPARAPSAALPRAMVLEPLSRRPLRLERATVAAALAAEPVPFARPPVLGPDSASIVVVSYDGLPFTRLCLTSLLANTAGEFELIVVDNGSIDGSEEYLVSLARADARVSVLLCGRNGGFPAACNRGLSLARGEHLVLVNNDTMFAPAWLGRLKAHLRNREVGLVGPVTNRIGNEAEVEVGYRTWGEYLAVARRRARDQAGEWIELRTPAMFCVAMRRDAYERIGPLDERYEIGMLEDDDYAERARQAGYQLRCAEDVLVHHFGEAAFGRLVASGEHARILRANKRRYAEKWGREWAPYPRRAKRSYELDSERLRETLSRTVPAGATVLVVSRGDDGLLQLDGQHALHFPQDTDGGWSGHHPADSEEAIGHLERLRAAGAEYLAVPPAYGWWLDHYAGLREHLDGHHEAIVREERGLAIYRLRASEDRCLQEALP